MAGISGFRSWGASLVIAAFTLQGGCVEAMGTKIAGKTPGDVFTSPHMADLADAACGGDARGVTRAIAAGANPNGVGLDGGTPLLWAVNCNNPQGVEALLKAGADPNCQVPGLMLLNVAAARAQGVSVLFVHEPIAHPDPQWKTGKISPTLASASAANPQVLRLLLAHGGDPNVDDGAERTAMEYALERGAEKGNWDNYYTLLKGGVDINRLGPDRRTIAVAAASLHKFDKVIELIERGYNRDLDYLGRMVQLGNMLPGNPLFAPRQKLEAMLEERGVHFPVPPLHRMMQ
ncbi:MAG: hypothetical protein JWM33_1864 [Caulobacteraceae bacterium]|nr:hypothetical protein [Caulobacteraceae bacterium]